MGKTTRKRYGAEFKAKEALEAIRGELTLSQLGAKYGVHQTMINAWKKQAVENLSVNRRGTLTPDRRPILTPPVCASSAAQGRSCGA